MSALWMGMVWELDLTHNKAQVLMAMVDHADHEGKNIFPRLRLIAWKTGYSLGSVKRIVAELRDDGILLPDGHTPGGVVKYRADFSKVPRKPPLPEAEPGRPEGSNDSEPRGPYGKRGESEKTPSHFDTPLFVTHNHQSLLSNSEMDKVTGTNSKPLSSKNYSDEDWPFNDD